MSGYPECPNIRVRFCHIFALGAFYEFCACQMHDPPKNKKFCIKWMEHIPMTPNNMNLAIRVLQRVLKLKFFFMSADLYS